MSRGASLICSHSGKHSYGPDIMVVVADMSDMAGMTR